MKRIAALVGCGVLLPALSYAAIAASKASVHAAPLSPEISLGAFWYETTTAASREKIRAEFKLHLQLLEQIDGAARERLDARKFKVQQNIEELLRRAHNADFEDPSLTELKRQIQTQVNETLGMRGAIEEVIVTDLTIKVLEVKPDKQATHKKADVYRELESDPAAAAAVSTEESE
jgi:flagellar basal body-associated protein FliL